MGRQLDIYDVLGDPDPNLPCPLRIGSLFSGVGGLDLAVAAHFGAEHAWLCEDDPERIVAQAAAASTDAERRRLLEHAAAVRHCHAVLARRFPGVPVHRDVRVLPGLQLGHVDILCGGFPCTPASVAGKRQGASDARWLWPEMLAVIRQTSPRFVVAENVRGLLSLDHGRLFGQVLADLMGGGYAVRWLAPHRRERVFILAERGVDGINHERVERPPWPPFAVLDGRWRRNVGAVDGAAYEQRWPKAGLAVDGAAYEQRWPTPIRHDGTGGPGGNHGDLQRDVNWAMPTASEQKGGAVVGNGRIGDASWATPLSYNNRGQRSGNKRDNWRPGLETQVANWATPLSSEGSTRRGQTMRGRNAQGGAALGEQVTWATPQQRDMKGARRGHTKAGRDLSRDVELWATPTRTDVKSSGSRSLDAGKAAHPGLTLTDQAVRGRTSYDRAEWPTPTRAAYGSANNGCPGDGRAEYATAGRPSLETFTAEGARRLSPDWVETLLGLPPGWTDDTCETDTAEALRVVRQDIREDSIQRTDGRRRQIRAATVLHPFMCQQLAPQRVSDAVRALQESRCPAGAREPLRDVRRGEDVRDPPCGRRPEQQREIQPDDPVSVLSHAMALAARQADPAEARVLRDLSEVSSFLGAHEARYVLVALLSMASGTTKNWPWPAAPLSEQHAFEPPRTTDEKRLRRQRLAVIGNAVVPQQARLALELLGAKR